MQLLLDISSTYEGESQPDGNRVVTSWGGVAVKTHPVPQPGVMAEAKKTNCRCWACAFIGNCREKAVENAAGLPNPT